MTHTLLTRIATHPDTFPKKSAMRPTSQGGGPENDATHGVLSTINPKLSPTKKGGGNLFGVVANSLGPSDLTEVKKLGRAILRRYRSGLPKTRLVFGKFVASLD